MHLVGSSRLDGFSQGAHDRESFDWRRWSATHACRSFCLVRTIGPKVVEPWTDGKWTIVLYPHLLPPPYPLCFFSYESQIVTDRWKIANLQPWQHLRVSRSVGTKCSRSLLLSSLSSKLASSLAAFVRRVHSSLKRHESTRAHVVCFMPIIGLNALAE